ncbi:hypothetical protein EDD18DRAFT_1120795 [Armillaria luteobubalina]|uniref:Uncharacterized protein n=1 Tax=Armillaria luteobubalina TaxID=153913 RepID=A0AA39V4Y0_9AGAR|nr:hypothetical protein EDD18DRAFT_1120795 [Armillaria luteobubalina]
MSERFEQLCFENVCIPHFDCKDSDTPYPWSAFGIVTADESTRDTIYPPSLSRPRRISVDLRFKRYSYDNVSSQPNESPLLSDASSRRSSMDFTMDFTNNQSNRSKDRKRKARSSIIYKKSGQDICPSVDTNLTTSAPATKPNLLSFIFVSAWAWTVGAAASRRRLSSRRRSLKPLQLVSRHCDHPGPLRPWHLLMFLWSSPLKPILVLAVQQVDERSEICGSSVSSLPALAGSLRDHWKSLVDGGFLFALFRCCRLLLGFLFELCTLATPTSSRFSRNADL